MERWVKWFCAAAAVATALSLYPFLAGESIEFRWWWYGFEAVAEQETEILPEQLEEIGRRKRLCLSRTAIYSAFSSGTVSIVSSPNRRYSSWYVSGKIVFSSGITLCGS